jgi:Subtilase family/Secretion system C-terminal sorting domain
VKPNSPMIHPSAVFPKITSVQSRYLFFSILLCFFVVYGQSLVAQKTIGKLHLKSGDVLIKENISEAGVNTELSKGKWNNQTFAILVFEKSPTAFQFQTLLNNGVELLHYFPDNAYQVRLKQSTSAALLKEAGVKSIVQLTGEMKYGKQLSEVASAFMPAQSVINISLQLMPGIQVKEVLPQLSEKGFVLTKDQYLNGGLLIGNISKQQLSEISALPFISYVNLFNFTPQVLNHTERGFYGLTALTSAQGTSRKLTGNGITVGVGDNADPTSHQDNLLNLVNRNPNIIAGSVHGTIVTSNVGGDGIIQERLTGTAPSAFLVTDYFDYMISKALIYTTDYGMTVSNNSYFTGTSGCNGNGDYNELSAYIDDQLYNNPFLQHVFAAGNDGSLTCTPYPAGFGTVKSGYQAAKNTLDVGSFNVVVHIISGFSSKGPLLDGRIKPEILASGGGVEGTGLNNAYSTSTGTSNAAPGVTGVWALLTERYKQLFGSNPKSALLKNILCNTASEIGNPGPDYSSGFGIMNAQRAVAAIEENRFYSNTVAMSGNQTQVIAVPAGIKKLKVMLYWHDKPGSPINPTALENDLDLTVTDGSTPYLPLILNPTPAFVNSNAVQGADHRNNIEQVVIDNPSTSVTVNVNGFNVTGSQEFFVSYEFVQPEIKLLYPYGGERFTTRATSGRAELIRWEANDNGSGTYKLEYSLDDGNNWVDIVDGIAATTFRYYWNVPPVNTNKARVRIRRSSGSVYTTSVGNFVITDLPSVTATVPCEGYVDLNWAAITGATDYQVMQLINGSLSTIATTTSNSYRVNGLDRNTTYWFTIRPRVGDSIARRADAKSIRPSSSSPCTDAAFDNDLKIDSLLMTTVGRAFTSTAYSPTQSITVRIKNLDDAISSGAYTVSYQVGAGPIINENPGINIAAGGTIDYTFSVPHDFSLTGNYSLRVFVQQAGDLRIENNERIYNIRHLVNNPLALPFTENFETTGNDFYQTSVTGLNNIDRFDYETFSGNGRLRTTLNTGMQISGNRSVYMDAVQFKNLPNDNKLYATFNMSSLAATPGLRFDFKFRNQGQLNSSTTDYVWMRGEDNQPWVQVYNLTANQGELGSVTQVSININEVMTDAGQTLTSSFQVRFDQSGMGTANNGSYLGGSDLDDGFAFDDIRIVAASNDLTVTQLVAPTTFNCSAGASSAITIRVKNTTASTVNNVPVYYRIDNGVPVTENITSIAANTTVDYTFITNADLSLFKAYDIDAWVQMPGDDYAVNDSLNNQVVHNSPVITGYPYMERFETTNGNYFTTGNYSSWKWGTTDPVRTFLKRAANGNKAWFTNLSGIYKNNENSYLYSPCFDLSSLSTPVLSFAHFSQQEDNFDYHTIEYTTDNGASWQRLGLENGGTNWFSSFELIWRLSITRWHVSSVVIPTNASSVRFRFLLNSDVFTQGEGIGIDDIRISEQQTVYTGPDVTDITETINGGSNWVDFTSAGNLVASINPLGQNMGNTTASVYFNTSGSVRFDQNQYYLDRNIVIKPTNVLTDSVLVRFYFSDAEATTMLNASNCVPCSKMTDAFMAGVTKFSGSVATMENGTLSDNTSGNYQFITPSNVDVIPFNNGYYAEFKVKDFSEFWINGGGPNFNLPLPVTLLNFSGTKRYPHVDLNWKTESESNSSHFEIERKTDDEPVFRFVAKQDAAGNSAQTRNYSFTDNYVLDKGRRFQYRLKMVDADGKYTYSGIVTIISGENDVFVKNVFNNTGSVLQIITGNKQGVRDMNIRITNTAGQTVMQLRNSYSDMQLDVSRLSAGIYFIEVKSSAGDSFIQKFIKK